MLLGQSWSIRRGLLEECRCGRSYSVYLRIEFYQFLEFLELYAKS